jgi:FHA domain-containing protein
VIEIAVKTYRGKAVGQPLAARFEEAGGTIGRGEGNRLFLPDPERHISRVQAEVVHLAGRYVLVNCGSNAIMVNGVPLESGSQMAIADGDVLQFGPYALGVTAGAAPAPAGAFAAPPPGVPAGGAAAPEPLFGAAAAPANLFADVIIPATPPVPAAIPAPAATPAPVWTPPPAPPPAAWTPPPAPPPAAPGSASDTPQALIPEDFDPFAVPEPKRAPPPQAPLPGLPGDDLGLGVGAAAPPSSLDAMFGLGPGASTDPLAGSPLAPAAVRPPPAGAADPLGVLGLAVPKPEIPAPMRDDVPELRGVFKPPKPLEPPQPAEPPRAQAPRAEAPRAEAPKAQPPRAEPPARTDMFLSWESEAATGSATTTLTLTQDMASRPAPPPPPPAAEPPAAAAAPPPPVAVGPSAKGAATAAAPARPDELLEAFLAGLGVPDLDLAEGLTPGIMRLVGELLRESVQGTLELLVARATTKREFRADVTMIVGRHNNPLKFSPDVAVALEHLLVPHGHGFMPPRMAMRDAYEDLRSHQFGFMAGLQAALAGVLQRFNPEALERRLKQRSMLDNLLPMHRKARMWDLFAELYEEIAAEAQEDFHALFGKEFLRAYEEQVKLLRETPPKS